MQPANRRSLPGATETVIRAGYGRSFDIGVFGSIFGHAATQNLPVLSKPADDQISGITGFAFSLAQGPAPQPAIVVPGNGLLPSPGYAVNSRSRPSPLRLPTLDAWNLSLQQSFTPTLSLTMAYVGNKGTHTLADGSGNNTNPNEAAIVLPTQYSVTGQQLHYDPTVNNLVSLRTDGTHPQTIRPSCGATMAVSSLPARIRPMQLRPA